MSAILVTSHDHRAEAIAFLIDAYDGVTVRPGKGLPHAQAVADVLRRAGYDERTQLLGLLHDVVEDTPRTIDDSASASASRSPRWSAPSPRTRRSSATRSASATCAPHHRRAGSPVVDVALADKIATLRHARLTGRPTVSDRKLRHYTVTLQLALTAGLATGPVQAARRADRAGRRRSAA